MKVSTFAFATFIAFTSTAISTANAYDQCAGHACNEYSRTGTAFEIAQQYTNGRKFGGVASGNTGTILDVARDSMNFLDAPELFASAWRVPQAPWAVAPTLAKGH
jgi:hypothetical protein